MGSFGDLADKSFTPRKSYLVEGELKLLRAIAILLVLCLSAQGESLLTLPNTSVRSGGSGSLAILLSDTSTPPPTAIQWTLSYSAEQVVSIEVTPGPAAVAADKSVTCAHRSEAIICMAYGLNANPIQPGTLAALTVRLRGGLVGGFSPLQLTAPIATSSAGDALPISAAGGTIAITREPSLVGE